MSCTYVEVESLNLYGVSVSDNIFKLYMLEGVANKKALLAEDK